MKVNKRHIGVYGSNKLERAYCPNCETTAFIIDGRIQCCDSKVDSTDEELEVKYLSEGKRKRKTIPYATKKLIIEFQDNKCFYCRKKFGTVYAKKGTNDFKVTTVAFDHISPHIYSRSNTHNIVAACNLCNGVKSDRMFESLEEAMKIISEEVNAKYNFQW